MSTSSDFMVIPQHIRALKPYIPGKPIEETQREYNVKEVIKLASNENPLGPSPKGLEAAKRSLSDLHRYSDPSGFLLKSKLAQVHNVKPNEIVLGNGSNDVVDYLVRVLCEKGDAILNPQHSFIAYAVCAQTIGVRTINTKVDARFQVDLDDLLKQTLAEPLARVVFLANPNNPTGTSIKTDDLEKFLTDLVRERGRQIHVVLDMAYWGYIENKNLPDPMEIFRKFSNVIVLHTFSKIYGLAGLRVGYGIAREDLAIELNKARQPFNVCSPALAAAESALSDMEFVAKGKKLNSEQKNAWRNYFGENKIDYIDSEGNFFLVSTSRWNKSGAALFEDCLRQGIILRPVTNYGLPNHIRISVGLEFENRKAQEVLKALIP